jgi:GNAT superfamily N-acetyltransferase
VRSDAPGTGSTGWLLSYETVPAGFAELERSADGVVEIVYFGLLPDFIGRGVGRAFLDAVVARAWDGGAGRVWLHTCTLDHPRALSHYLSAGFRVVREEAYTARLETPVPT